MSKFSYIGDQDFNIRILREQNSARSSILLKVDTDQIVNTEIGGECQRGKFEKAHYLLTVLSNNYRKGYSTKSGKVKRDKHFVGMGGVFFFFKFRRLDHY